MGTISYYGEPRLPKHNVSMLRTLNIEAVRGFDSNVKMGAGRSLLASPIPVVVRDAFP